jgi:hypothetical protein
MAEVTGRILERFPIRSMAAAHEHSTKNVGNVMTARYSPLLKSIRRLTFNHLNHILTGPQTPLFEGFEAMDIALQQA